MQDARLPSEGLQSGTAGQLSKAHVWDDPTLRRHHPAPVAIREPAGGSGDGLLSQ